MSKSRCSCMCLAFVLLIAVNAFGQPGGGPTAPPVGTTTINVTAFSVTPTDLPMGSEFILDCNHDQISNPQYQWTFSCDGGLTWNAQPGAYLNKKLIDCHSLPSEIIFKITVSNGTHSGEDQVTVEFHEPDDATCTIDGGTGTIPTKTNPKHTHQQILTTKLFWNNQPLGPCANVCFRERVSILVNPLYKTLFPSQGRFQLGWFPVNCPTAPYKVFGNPNLPTRVTMQWKSPELKDRNWWVFTYLELQNANKLPVGTVIATRRHQYMFEGNRCSGITWGPFLKTIVLRLKVVQALDANGQPIPIPNTNPTQYNHVLRWSIVP